MFMMVHICSSLTATQGKIVKIKPAYNFFLYETFSLLPSPIPPIEGSPSCLALGYWEKRQMFQCGRIGKKSEFLH